MDVDGFGLLAAAEACSTGSVASFGKPVPVPERAAAAERQADEEGHLAYRAVKQAERGQLELGCVSQAE